MKSLNKKVLILSIALVFIAYPLHITAVAGGDSEMDTKWATYKDVPETVWKSIENSMYLQDVSPDYKVDVYSEKDKKSHRLGGNQQVVDVSSCLYEGKGTFDKQKLLVRYRSFSYDAGSGYIGQINTSDILKIYDSILSGEKSYLDYLSVDSLYAQIDFQGNGTAYNNNMRYATLDSPFSDGERMYVRSYYQSPALYIPMNQRQDEIVGWRSNNLPSSDDQRGYVYAKTPSSWFSDPLIQKKLFASDLDLKRTKALLVDDTQILLFDGKHEYFLMISEYGITPISDFVDSSTPVYDASKAELWVKYGDLYTVTKVLSVHREAMKISALPGTSISTEKMLSDTKAINQQAVSQYHDLGELPYSG